MSTGSSVKNRSVGDVFLYEASQMYNRSSGYVTNGGLNPVDLIDPAGYPIKAGGTDGFTLALAGDEGSVIGLLAYDKNLLAIPNGGDTVIPLAVVDRSPVVVAVDAVPANDVDGGAFNWTTIRATLEALGWKFLDDSPKRSEQTT